MFLWYLAKLLQWLYQEARETDISYVDSTHIAVCQAKTIFKNNFFLALQN